MEAHHAAVTRIAASVRQFFHRKEPFRIYHGSTNSTRESQHRRDNTIDTSELSNILNVDTEKNTALVEPNVPMDGLVEGTLRHGLVPQVVMEFPGITAGGGFSGTSGESSSFRYGFFDRTVTWIEMVLANGDIVTASNTEKPDLFQGSAAAFGTLGVVTLLEIQLVEAKDYVELTYFPAPNMNQAMGHVENATNDPSVDYLDGIVYALDRIVICSGRLTDSVPNGAHVQHFFRSQDPWFYLHVRERTANASGPIVEFVPLMDYLFRYDRGAFWVAKYAFKYFKVPFLGIFRRLLDRFMRTRVMYHALHTSGHSKRYIVQDVALPYEATEDFLQWLHKEFAFYPLWLCPLRLRGQAADSPYGLLADTADSNAPDYLMNFGVWGPGSTNRREFVLQNRKLERKVQELQGNKWLYAQTYYTQDEFETIYSSGEHDGLRAKYHATYLPSLYDKVKVDVPAEEKAAQATLLTRLKGVFWSIWPLSGLYGVYKAWRGGDYLLQKERAQNLQALKTE